MSMTYTELLLLPDGRILVHNLTPAMAALLHELDPAAQSMIDRATVMRRRRRKTRTQQRIKQTPHKP